MASCSVNDCPKPAHGRGLCSMHLSRFKRTGSLDATVIRGSGPEVIEARYWQKVDRRGPDECWPWTASLTVDGYGQFNRTVAGNLAHRYTWWRTHGELPPDGHVIDHTCHDPAECAGGPSCLHRRCQNPAHMVVVANSTNVSPERRVTPQALRTHCPQGHPYDEANTLWSTSRATGRKFRQCRACHRERARAAARRT